MPEKKTKRGLLHILFPSILGMLLCMGSLAGLSWAWFEDRASSNISIIRAGLFDPTITLVENIMNTQEAAAEENHSEEIRLENPATEETRIKMGETAVLAAKTVGYESAGTIEFLLADSGEFFFMEMNTRIQVEHPVTEFVSGLDLVKEQIRVAAGLPLSVKQEEIQMNGHAIECRINAENPAKNFMPCPGTIENLYIPGGNGVRIDTAVYNGYHIPPNYDSMIMKVIVHDRDRESAIAKMRSTLGEVIIEGVQTNLDFQYDILNQKDFLEGNVTTHFIEEHYE